MKKSIIPLLIVICACNVKKQHDTESQESGFLTSGFVEMTTAVQQTTSPDTTSGVQCETITQCVEPCPENQILGIHRLCTMACEDSYDCPGMIAGEVCIEHQCVVVCDTSVEDSCTDVSGAECVAIFGVDVCAAKE